MTWDVSQPQHICGHMQPIYSVTVNNNRFIVGRGWEFIKEKKKKVRNQENTHASTKKRTRSRKHALDQESAHERTTNANCLHFDRKRAFLVTFLAIILSSSASSFFSWTRLVECLVSLQQEKKKSVQKNTHNLGGQAPRIGRLGGRKM